MALDQLERGAGEGRVLAERHCAACPTGWGDGPRCPGSRLAGGQVGCTPLHELDGSLSVRRVEGRLHQLPVELSAETLPATAWGASGELPSLLQLQRSQLLLACE